MEPIWPGDGDLKRVGPDTVVASVHGECIAIDAIQPASARESDTILIVRVNAERGDGGAVEVEALAVVGELQLAFGRAVPHASVEAERGEIGWAGADPSAARHKGSSLKRTRAGEVHVAVCGRDNDLARTE